MVSDVFLEQLRNACPLEEIARTYVDLKRRGRTYVCNCPFHSEKHRLLRYFPIRKAFIVSAVGLAVMSSPLFSRLKIWILWMR